MRFGSRMRLASDRARAHRNCVAFAEVIVVAETGFEILERQHRDIAELFDRVHDPEADRSRALAEAIKQIATHVAVERTYLYPLLKQRRLGSARLGRELLADYKRMEKLLVMVDRRKLNSPDMPELISELAEVFDEHHKRCSTMLMPAMERQLSPAELERVGARMLGAENMILSHPHPYLLLLGGPVYQWTTRLASKWDRVRDRTVRNR